MQVILCRNRLWSQYNTVIVVVKIPHKILHPQHVMKQSIPVQYCSVTVLTKFTVHAYSVTTSRHIIIIDN